MTAIETADPPLEVCLSAFFAAALGLVLVGIGVELGAAAAGASIDPVTLAAMGSGAVPAAGGLWWLIAGD